MTLDPVWIATGNQLLCIEPFSSIDADAARSYMHAYNRWLNHRDPSQLDKFRDGKIEDKNRHFYLLQHDRRAITKIDRRENGVETRLPKLSRVFLAPPTLEFSYARNAAQNEPTTRRGSKTRSRGSW